MQSRIAIITINRIAIITINRIAITTINRIAIITINIIAIITTNRIASITINRCSTRVRRPTVTLSSSWATARGPRATSSAPCAPDRYDDNNISS